MLEVQPRELPPGGRHHRIPGARRESPYPLVPRVTKKIGRVPHRCVHRALTRIFFLYLFGHDGLMKVVDREIR